MAILALARKLGIFTFEKCVILCYNSAILVNFAPQFLRNHRTKFNLTLHIINYLGDRRIRKKLVEIAAENFYFDFCISKSYVRMTPILGSLCTAADSVHSISAQRLSGAQVE